MSKNSVNLEERILQTAVRFQAMTVTETKSWESNRGELWAYHVGYHVGVFLRGTMVFICIVLKWKCNWNKQGLTTFWLNLLVVGLL